jgi:hypothetical protein
MKKTERDRRIDENLDRQGKLDELDRRPLQPSRTPPYVPPDEEIKGFGERREERDRLQAEFRWLAAQPIEN